MANIVSVNIKSRTVGQEGTIKNFFFGTKNSIKYSPAVVRGFDTNDFVGPVTTTGGVTYFTTRDRSNSDNNSNKDYHIDWTSSDSLTTIQSQSSDLIILTGLFRDEMRQVPLNSQKMIFDVNKMVTGAALIPDPVSGGTIFNYVEEGNPQPMQYTVAETIAYIAAGTSPTPPPPTFSGYELYVNDKDGNDATAQISDPLAPWATFDAAMTVALTKAFSTTIIITGGSQNSVNNAYGSGVNIQINPAATLTINNYTATGAGSQQITGKGSLFVSSTTGINALAGFSGQININIGVFIANNTYGVLNASTSLGIVNVYCDYSQMNANCKYLYAVTGTSKIGNWRTNFYHNDISTQNITTFFINPSSLIIGNKIFNLYIYSGVSVSANEGLLCVANIDSTYNVNAEFYVQYTTGNSSNTALNALLVAWNCTGGVLTLKGINTIQNAGRHALILNSTITVFDYSNTYQQGTNIQEIATVTGGACYYTLYGKHLSLTHTSGIFLGSAFTAANATQDFGTPTISAGGTDTLHFKGGLKCTYANNAAVGITVAGANPNLFIDGGIIEMVNSNTTNDAIHAGSAQNYKILGTGFTRGVVNSNLTNTITGTNIVTDPGVKVNM
jgi:hypothetical protein